MLWLRYWLTWQSRWYVILCWKNSLKCFSWLKPSESALLERPSLEGRPCLLNGWVSGFTGSHSTNSDHHSVPSPILGIQQWTKHTNPCPWGAYIQGLEVGVRQTMNQISKLYRMLEGDGAKKKQKARKNRPEGRGGCAVLNRIREDSRKRWGSWLCFCPRQREEVQGPWGQSTLGIAGGQHERREGGQ